MLHDDAGESLTAIHEASVRRDVVDPLDLAARVIGDAHRNLRPTRGLSVEKTKKNGAIVRVVKDLLDGHAIQSRNWLVMDAEECSARRIAARIEGKMKKPGLDGRHRDKNPPKAGEIQQKRGDTLNKNLPKPVPEFPLNTRWIR
jgi:hypothetical protein